MPKNNDDTYYSEGGGIYCFLTYDNIEDDGTGVFKVGKTKQTFQQRLQQYHTYFIHGVIPVALLYIYDKKYKAYPLKDDVILNDIEDYILKDLDRQDGHIIVEGRRTYKKGQSEFVYCNIRSIMKAFDKAEIYFKKKYNHLGFIKEVQTNYRNRVTKPHFIGEYIVETKK